MLLPVLAIIVGFILLIWGADRFVLGSSAMARSLGVPPLLIGLTVVAFGTSAPEVLVSATAAYEGNPGMGIGNAIGSNITNIALVIGCTAIIAPLTVHSTVLRREFPVLVLCSAFGAFLLWDRELSRLDGLLLLCGLAAMMAWVIWIGKSSSSSDPLSVEYESELPPPLPLPRALLWFLIGLVVLLISSRGLVWGASEIASSFGVSDLVIGLTIVAIGTSLPELAASIMGALKGEDDIAIGNVIGSNMFNILGVLAMPGLIAPGVFDDAVLERDYPFMFALTLGLWVMARGLHGHGKVTRVEGGVLVGVFVAYLVFLYQAEVVA